MLKFAKSDRVRQEGRITPDVVENKKQKVIEVREVSKETTELEVVFKQFENLRKSHEDFEKFLDVVLSDLMVKMEGLKRIRECEKSKRNDKSYASVQLFMLTQYNHRINRFKIVADDSLDDICKKHGKENEVTSLVIKHIDVLGKMKRRMKHMVDVAEKYAVTDMFDTLNMLHEMEEELNPQLCKVTEVNSINNSSNMRRKMSRQSKSLFSINNAFLDMPEVESASPRNIRIKSIGCSEMSSSSELSSAMSSKEGGRGPKMNTFRSLTDHLTVLTKSYTNRR